MANQNFVVHNGLTVGPTTIWAGNGDIISSGNITVAGNISITGGISVNQINDGTSQVLVGPSAVNVTVAGTQVGYFSTTGEQITGNLIASKNITASTMTVNTTAGLTINGAVAATLADATAITIALS